MPTDPRHGRTIPTGRPLARVLRRLLRRVAGDVTSRWRTMPFSAPRLDGWIKPVAEACRPLLAPYYREGGNAALRRIARTQAASGRPLPAVRRARLRAKGGYSGGTIGGALLLRMPLTRKDRAAPPRLEIAFDVFNPRVSEAIDRAAFDFAESTLATITGDVGRAIAKLRDEMKAGLEAGEALTELQKRVRKVIADPARAARVAASEASRAMHAGQLMAAKDAGITKKRWLASADACPLCLDLDDKEIGIDAAFIEGSGYGRIMHPPAHPFSACVPLRRLLSDYLRTMPSRLQGKRRGAALPNSRDGREAWVECGAY